MGLYPDIYIKDNSYVQVPSYTYPAKVFWDRPGDHSGVTNSQGSIVSKWNKYPLMVHAANYGPYGTSCKYFVQIPTISGPTNTCSATASFTVSNPPAGFTWDKSLNFTITSNSGNSITVNGSGNGWVSIKLGATTLVTHQVAMATSAPVFYWIDGPDEVTPSGNSYFYEANVSRATEYEWSIAGAPSSWYDIFPVGGGSMAYLYFYGEATYQVTVTGFNACGSDYGSMIVSAYNRRSQSPAYTVYPNPVDDILSIEIHQPLSNANKPLRYDIHLYDLQGNLVRQTTVNQAGVVQINVSNLPDGNYFLHIYDGTGAKPYMKQIVVKH